MLVLCFLHKLVITFLETCCTLWPLKYILLILKGPEMETQNINVLKGFFKLRHSELQIFLCKVNNIIKIWSNFTICRKIYEKDQAIIVNSNEVGTISVSKFIYCYYPLNNCSSTQTNWEQLHILSSNKSNIHLNLSF